MAELTEEKKLNKDIELRARVFISCGQQKKSNEEEIAYQIKEKLDTMGYDAYVAIKDQITKGFTENIFQRLENSEYIIFIDFKREELNGNIISLFFKKNKKFRGSLFSNQELAIGAYLDKPIIAFQEKGVKEKDGILSVIQVNPIEFSSRFDLVDKVISKVLMQQRENEWNCQWRDELVLERTSDDTGEANYGNDPKKPSLFFHIKVKNNHLKKIAWRCVSYIENIKYIDSGKTKIFGFNRK